MCFDTNRIISLTVIDLNQGNLQKFYDGSTVSGDTRYVYVVEGVRQTGESLPYLPPCTNAEESRWILDESSCASPETVTTSTAAIFEELISNSLDTNTNIKDIIFPSLGVSCDASDVGKYDFVVTVNGQCWRNVHRNYHDVFDFTGTCSCEDSNISFSLAKIFVTSADWVARHNGGEAAIKQFALDGSFTLQYPANHPMNQRFYDTNAVEARVRIGRLGDQIRFRDLPSFLTTEEVADAFGKLENFQSLGPKVVCGSPFEVGNDPLLLGDQLRGSFDFNSGRFPAVSISKHREIVVCVSQTNHASSFRPHIRPMTMTTNNNVQ